MDTRVLLRAAACVYSAAMLAVSHPARAAEGSSCSNRTFCDVGCNIFQVILLCSLNPEPGCNYGGYLCGSGGGSCGGGSTVICSYGET